MTSRIAEAVLALLVLPAAGLGQTLALTFDDGLDPTRQPQAAEWNAAILDALDEAGVQATFFVAGSRVDSPEGLALVRDWGEAGHQVANHTYSHRNLGSSKTMLEDFVADVERNQALLEGLPGWTRRFRFPYLKEGATAEKRDDFRAWLVEHGYRSGAVSIDASDWYYDQRYRAWREAHADADPAPFRDAYLDHLWDRALFYDGLAERVLERRPAHVLLLHINAINAAFLGDVIARFRSRGWSIVSSEEAFVDPLYSTRPTTLPAGESIVWSLARQAGVEDLRYPAEDGAYEAPILDELGL